MRRLLSVLAFTLGLSTAAAIAPAFAQGTVRVALGTTLSQLDPAKTTIGDEYVYVHLVFNGLSRIDPDMTVKPDLAESWSASDDLKTWTFKLRQGVKFHHGRVMNSEDVVATMKRILDPATGSRSRTSLSMVDNVTAVDPLTVKFDLNISYAGFADIFADRNLRIVPKDKLTELSTNPIGTGPFMFKSWSPGDRLELVKNPDYFEKGLPKLDGVTLRIVPESAARIAALESGSLDIVWSMAYESVDKFKNHPTVRTDSVSTPTWDGVILNNDRPPFNDVRVRQALALTIDKSAIVELALFGQGDPTFSPIPPSHPYFNKSLPFNPPDIAKAKKLLAEAGFPNGFDVPMQVPQEREQRVRVGVAVRDMAKAAGIRINVERVPFASYTANVAGKAQMYVDGYFARPTIDTAIYPFYHSTGSWNKQLWLYKDARVDQLLDEARKTNDEAARKALFEKFQAVVEETVPGIIAYSAAHVNGVSKKVEGFKSTPMQWLELKSVSLKP
ncbi:ABC transporter substrate-binding protein [Bosea lathyri]|uniref:Peptide/nickel transport system substrate-binding protein n=1 Tax=Bosea lathyri TaxID=1036778 RepID=A0A1H5ZVX4_9HYPH|nr:ABC transporter substrate-binding protein [Bosea lathyri]SEG40341.1 peptide/nickel transport system substrate-binding protein [Bosea lathyri]